MQHLEAGELTKWRDDVVATTKLKRSSINRILKDIRAACTFAADSEPARIKNRHAWKVGLAKDSDIANWERAIRAQLALARSLRLSHQSRGDPQMLGRRMADRLPTGVIAPWHRDDLLGGHNIEQEDDGDETNAR